MLEVKMPYADCIACRRSNERKRRRTL